MTVDNEAVISKPWEKNWGNSGNHHFSDTKEA